MKTARKIRLNPTHFFFDDRGLDDFVINASFRSEVKSCAEVDGTIVMPFLKGLIVNAED